MGLIEDAFNIYSGGTGFLTGQALGRAIQASGGNPSLAELATLAAKKVDLSGFKALVTEYTTKFADELKQAFRVFDRGDRCSKRRRERFHSCN